MDYLVRQYGISERRACNLMEQHRSTQRYAAMSSEQDQSVVLTTDDSGAEDPGAEDPGADDSGAEDWIAVHDEDFGPGGTGGTGSFSQFRPVLGDVGVEEIPWPTEIPAARSTRPPTGGTATGRDSRLPGQPGGGAHGLRGVVHEAVSFPFRLAGGATRRAADSGSSCAAGACSAAARVVELLPPRSQRLVHQLCPRRHTRPD